ncbi:flagellar biosynthesis protein FlgO [Pseudoalteromonas sp. SR43-6]|uniref:FlgO family outer membrane protein n=1 Tax=unclassified Pseudoalteromonas TaxID=194690 RepID=UPI0015FCC1AD|nr:MULTISPECIES: FlgO family outer membrane protein [unclassified Pseudoalteromonas]MBB1290926.1 flagellar biosynthesis protein FlgO [Pseudoalteromonas sp. SR41-5]MBB1376370.1 flagellar biosynthesis protein FlgO [Pseudoalteromonas sp. SR43-6]MBB1415501.1 flagellar biosynthesis protein FlgO [Pseudoalteromonas sp. SG43-8]
MYSKLLNRFIVFFALANLTGCAFTQNNESAEMNASSTTQVNYDLASMLKTAEQKSTQDDANGNQFTPLQHHKTLANYVEQMALDLVDTLEYESDTDTNINIAVTTLVDLDSSLTKSNQLGNQISETLIHQLQKFGYGVVDFKTTQTIDVNSRGDFAFSRDIEKLSEEQMASHVLAGTLIYRHDAVVVNTRVINAHTKKIVASSRKLIPIYVLNKEDIYLSSN